MKFSDLSALPFDKNTGIIDTAAIAAALPETPIEVVQQLYADHGRKHEFQHAYGNMDISQIRWALIGAEARALAIASMNEKFRRWFAAVGDRAANFSEFGWSCIDSRKSVIAHWQDHKTWLVPPVLLSAALVGSNAPFHLAEGHTRVGLLAGLVRQNVLASGSVHTIWLGGQDAA